MGGGGVTGGGDGEFSKHRAYRVGRGAFGGASRGVNLDGALVATVRAPVQTAVPPFGSPQVWLIYIYIKFKSRGDCIHLAWRAPWCARTEMEVE